MSITDEWIALVVGRALDPDGHYGNQCVDAVDHYGEFIFGVPWPQSVGAVSGARQLLDAAPDAFWIRIDYFHGFIPQRGDVLVYGGDASNTWGHTAIVEAATNTYIDVLQQDGFGAPLKFVDGAWYSDKPAHRARLAYSQKGTGPLKGVLRPRPEKLKSSTIQPQSTNTTPLEDILDMANPEQLDRLLKAADRINGVITEPTAKVLTVNDIPKIAAASAGQVFNTPIKRQGKGAALGEFTSFGAVLAWDDHGTLEIIAAIAASAASDGASVEQIRATILEAMKSTVNVEVSVKGAESNG